AKYCLANGICGFELLASIPGTICGGIAMNAGCYGREFGDIVNSVEAVDKNGNLLQLSLADIGFCKRSNSLPQDLVFTRVFFNVSVKGNVEQIRQKMEELADLRRSSQPVTEKTGGSTFVNPEGFKAWELIDRAGLRGIRLGG